MNFFKLKNVINDVVSGELDKCLYNVERYKQNCFFVIIYTNNEKYTSESGLLHNKLSNIIRQSDTAFSIDNNIEVLFYRETDYPGAYKAAQKALHSIESFNSVSIGSIVQLKPNSDINELLHKNLQILNLLYKNKENCVQDEDYLHC